MGQPAMLEGLEEGEQALEVSEVLLAVRLSDVPVDWTGAVGIVLSLREAERRKIETGEHELQSESDRFRRLNGLLLKDQMFGWLENQGLSLDGFEERIRRRIVIRKLRDQMFESSVETYFSEHPTEFDWAYLSQIVVAKEGVAQELMNQIVDDGDPFERLAQKHSIDEESRKGCGHIGRTRRSDMIPMVESLVFGASAGQVVGPVKTAAGYHLLKVHAMTHGKLDSETRDEIKAKLFNAWVRKSVRGSKFELRGF